MNSPYLFVSITAAFALVGASCSSSSSSSTGPRSASGGNGGASGAQAGGGGQTGASNTGGGSGAQGGSGSCGPNVVPCGGSPVGGWSVTSSCLAVSGERNLEAVGLGCTSAPVTGSLQVSGSWTANADGTFTDQTTTTGKETLSLAAKCLQVSGTTTDCDRVPGFVQALGYESVICSPATAGGCTCVGTVNHQGGVGLLSTDSVTSGNYTVANNTIKTGQDALRADPKSYVAC